MNPPKLPRVAAFALPALSRNAARTPTTSAIRRIPRIGVRATSGPIQSLFAQTATANCGGARFRPLVGTAELAVVPGREALGAEADRHALRCLRPECGGRVPLDRLDALAVGDGHLLGGVDGRLGGPGWVRLSIGLVYCEGGAPGSLVAS